MARHIKQSAFIILTLATLLVGCTSKKVVQNQENIGTSTATIAKLPAITPDTVALQYLTSSTSINLTVGSNNVNVKGKLRIKRGEGVQISITPLGLVEAACIEFLPQKIRFINKLFKTYTEVPYSEASAVGLSGINYNVLEAIFLNHTFLPDGRLACNGLNELNIEEKGENYCLNTKEEAGMQYSFLVDKKSGNLVSCDGHSNTGESFKCDYADFADVATVSYPNDICINFKGDATIRLNFKLNKTNNKSFSFSSRSVNSSYSKQSFGDFIKTIK